MEQLIVVWPIYTPGPPDWATETDHGEPEPPPRRSRVDWAVTAPVMQRLLREPRTIRELLARTSLTESQLRNVLQHLRLTGQVQSTYVARSVGRVASYQWVG